ncbi:uroporphyrinogen-III synthase [Amaricoccus tamworthensis]|uniref:uroporphyrinogen-III synthase n=1 Tax=Amaricoccus tamworthensis TaxID=57002 RepID=UPI003C7C7F6E
MRQPPTLLLTRPERQSRAFADVLEAEAPGRFRIVTAPLLTIAPVPGELDLTGITHLLFTSANGVEQFAARTPDRSIPALCVGAMTAAAARRAGFSAKSADGDVHALTRLAVTEHTAGEMLHVRGRHAAGDLTGALKAQGIPARAAEIYSQGPARPDSHTARMLATRQIDILTFFSPRTAAVFADLARENDWDLSHSTAVSLSPAADSALGDLTLADRLTAKHPDREGILRILLDFWPGPV